MKIYAPDYFKSFKCIASLCRHNCCIGWEIDVDDETYEYYRTVKGELGEKLRKNISVDACPHFILGENERCPFLNSENLCDIITALGEDSLCRICRDHPRYRSFYSDREEIGVGLACEAASALIVGKEDKTEIVLLSDDGEKCEMPKEEAELLLLRQRLFDVLQNRNEDLYDRLTECQRLCKSLEIPDETGELCTYFSELEYMEEDWHRLLCEMSKSELSCFLPKEYHVPLEQLAVYFLYRYIVRAVDGDDIGEVVALCVLCTKMISAMCRHHLSKHGSLLISDISELARLFSAQIEYSDENVDELIFRLCVE